MAMFEIVLKPDAVENMDRLRKYDATMVSDAIEKHLGDAPGLESKSTIKRLKGKQKADYRLRVGAYRVFYSIEGQTVYVLRVLHKKETPAFYGEESR